MWSNGDALPAGYYPLPPVLPPEGHPRLLLRPEHLPELRNNLKAAQNETALAAWKTLLLENSGGVLPAPPPGKDNFDAKLLAAIEAWSYSCVLLGCEEAGRTAISAILRFMESCVYDGLLDNCRHMGQAIFTAAEVYDWCYPLLTEQEKRRITALCEKTAAHMEIGYPPVKQGAVCGHGGEAQLMRNLLGFSIAVYDERPDIYQFCAGRFFSEFIEPRNYWAPAHAHHQGIAYGSYRYSWDIWAAWIFKRMCGIDVFCDEMGLIPYEWLYSRRPDGQMLRNGDDFMEYKEKSAYWTGFMVPLFFAANYYGDPYLKGEFQREMALERFFPQENATLTPVQYLLLNDPALDGLPLNTLPRTKYFPSPYGAMITRTGWEMGSEDILVFMKIGERWGANHNHLDAGHFQIYQKGILASDSGFYGRYGELEDGNYNKRTVAHNCLLIFDPEEKVEGYPPHLNDGGQRFPNGGKEPAAFGEWMAETYRTGRVLAHSFSTGQNPIAEYSFLSGDLTAAYGEKAERVLRSMAFFPQAGQKELAVFVVFDQVISAKAGFQKTWLLHTSKEPLIEENRITVQNGGGMVVESLLPQNPVITAIGGTGKEFWLDGRNLTPESPPPSGVEAGWGRVEITAPCQEKKTFFLHLCTLGQPETPAQVQEDRDFFYLICPSVTVIWVKDAPKPPVSLEIFGLPEKRLFIGGLSNGWWRLGETAIPVTDHMIYMAASPQDIILQKQEDSAPSHGIN